MNDRQIQELAAQLGRRIAGLRSIRGLSQPKLAKRAGMSRGFLSEIETGKSIPSYIILLKIAHALNVSLGYFDLLDEDRQDRNAV